MRKQAPTIEWQIVEHDADWERLQATDRSDSAPSANQRQPPKYYLGVVAALLLLLVSAGGWWGRTAQDRAHQTEIGATAIAPLELRAVEQVGELAAVSLPGDQTTSSGLLQEGLGEYRSLYTAVQTTEPADHGDITVSTVEVGGSRGIAHIVTTPKDGAPAYRQTRFYRRIGPDWRQISPEAAHWPPARSLETPYFVFRFRQHDAQAVIAVAPRIDALYTTLWHNFGLPIMPTPGRLAVYVSGTQNPGNARFEPHNYEQFVWEDRLVVASPSLYLVPVDITDIDLLAQSLALPLIAQVLTQASEQDQIGSAWQPMLKGLRLWQVWDMDLPLALWREEIVRWIYLDRPGAGSAQTVVLPKRYEAFCASHALWMEAPTMVGVPLLCNGLDWQAWYTGTWGPRHPPIRLDQLAVPAPDGYTPEGTPVWGQTVALATLIEYAVDTYGRERLPALVAGLSKHESWNTLLPAVFGVSAAEFEAGWRAYLATRYGVSPNMFQSS
jgi:hypothetical protein